MQIHGHLSTLLLNFWREIKKYYRSKTVTPEKWNLSAHRIVVSELTYQPTLSGEAEASQKAIY